MKYCLNNHDIACTGRPILLDDLTFEYVKQPDGTTKRVWYKRVSCALSYPSCGSKAYAQLPLTTE